MLKLKFCLQSLQITRTHMTSWFDAFFNAFDMILNVAIEKFKHIDETDELIIFSISTCFFCEVNETNEQVTVVKHWFDIFFIDFDAIFSALNERWEFFDEMIVSKIITDSNFCFDVTIKISNFCEIDEANKLMTADFFIVSRIILCVSIERFEFFDEVISKIIWHREMINEIRQICKTNVSMTVNLFSISHIDLTVSIEKDELLTNFFACCSRTCSRNFFLKLKIWSHLMQIIFDNLTFANATWTNSIRKTSIHSFNDAEFNTSCLSYQISKTKFQRQVSNNISRFDFRYKCWHCWKCCKKFANSLNRRFSHVSVESKISICWNVDVDFAISSAFNVFDLIRLAFLIALNLVFFAIFRAFNFCCSCCFYEANDFDEMNEIVWFVANSLEENAFVKAISKSCNDVNFDWFSNQFKTKSQRQSCNKSSKSDFRCWCWNCRNCRKMFVTSQNNSNSKSFCVSFESKKSKNANEINEANEAIKANFAEFSKISHVNFDARIEKDELLSCLKKMQSSKLYRIHAKK